MSALPRSFDARPDPSGTAAGLGSPPRLVGQEPSELSPAQIAELERARRLARPLRRAARVASIGGWSTILFGAIGAPFALGDLQTLALALALIALGYNELCARRALIRFDLRAPRRLALAQLALMGVLIAYALLNISDLTPITVPDAQVSAALSPSGAIDTSSLESLSSAIALAIYAGLIVGTILFQGSTALFYILKRRPLRRFLSSTPPWVVQTMRALQAL